MNQLLLVCVLSLPYLDQEKLSYWNDKIENLQNLEFMGTLDLDENQRIVFKHFPDGYVKPAIVYIHPVVFEKRSSKLKAYKYLGKNIKIHGTYMKLGTEEFIYVKDIELFVIDA